MKALVKTAGGPGQMVLMDRPVPEIQPGEVLVQVYACGICGTDLKILDGSFACDPPVIIGHEFAGVISACGSAVSQYRPGERVIAEQHFESCGICEFCLQGKRHWCSRKKSPGYRRDGAFAEYIAVRQDLLHRIPATMSFEQACLVEPMGVAAYAILEKTGINPEDAVVILGCGPIALLAVQMVRAAGAALIIVTGLDSDARRRFALARKLGADAALNVHRENIPQIVLNLTEGRGADVVVDLTGSPAAILQGLQLLKRGGRFTAIGMPHDPVTLPWTELIFKAIRLDFCFSANYRSWQRCLSLIRRGAVDLADFTNAVYPLSEWEKGFAVAQSGEALKVILRIVAAESDQAGTAD
jgi:L-iditol 2-dehydrogenase